ncbi:hypothetical protein FHX44_111510 [Pseudonocardia hierapolitana]|uniref:Uncharacterized protein n=1 Tax=Pseudonocardia hierapolitana TaxID=1128676 RepID=A0A561SLA7_9PSEU|nr:hypothetical protein [Pseudonocardia hierapolitana]TWF75626.1 hypothetical protein FHX44_111510 [Pseudonocardia hierapolitana]
MDLCGRSDVPAGWGITGFSTRSLTKLREHLLAEGIVAEVSRETLRRILRAGGVSSQITTTLKPSTDPDVIGRDGPGPDLMTTYATTAAGPRRRPLNTHSRKDTAWRPRAGRVDSERPTPAPAGG